MSNKNKLTILLPLKGREEYTHRWISYHAKIGLEYKILIGDGNPDSDVADFLTTSSDASVLDYEYRQFCDSDLLKYYNKMITLLKLVETPYVMIANNDDFILPSGVEKSISFLDENKDYVSCGGANIGIYGVPKNFRSDHFPNSINPCYTGLSVIYDPVIIDQKKSEDRVVNTFDNYQPTWYSVHKTECVLHIFNTALESKMGDLLVLELFQASYMSAVGKVSQGYGFATYVRQLNTSESARNLPDIYDRTYRGTMVRDSRKILSLVSDAVCKSDGITFENAEDSVTTAFVNYHRANGKNSAQFFSFVTGLIKAVVHTLRAKVPFFHRLMNEYELRKLLQTIGGGQENDVEYRHLLKDEIDKVFDAMTRAEK